LSGRLLADENGGTVVVQCPTCQSKFRIADDKVTDRGVRVRCTSCKNVFQVRKPGATVDAPAPGPGSTMEMSSLDAAQVARPKTGPVGRPGGSASRPPPSPASRPAASSRPAAAVRSGPNGAARRLDANDLFGMAELTGDAPLADLGPARTPPPPKSAGVSKPIPNFDDIDLEVSDEPSGPPPRKPPSKQPPPVHAEAAEAVPPPPPEASPAESPPAEAPSEYGEAGPVKIGAFKTNLKDPFEGLSFGEGGAGAGAVELPAQARKEKPEAAEAKTEPPKPAEAEMPPTRAMVSSALTGLLGAALAIAVVIASAVSDDAAAGWLGLTPGSEIVATRVVSGLYDTAAGKPVFFVRGRVENRSARVRGPIRITAELISDGAPEAKAEIIAGTEPTPEDVWSLRSTADVEKLHRTLEVAPVDRKLQPGASLPFFAVIADPPADLVRHRLHVKVESVDAWNPPSPTKAAKVK